MKWVTSLLIYADDRIVRIIYGLDSIRDQQKFGAMLSLTTDAFSSPPAAASVHRLFLNPSLGDPKEDS